MLWVILWTKIPRHSRIDFEGINHKRQSIFFSGYLVYGKNYTGLSKITVILPHNFLCMLWLFGLRFCSSFISAKYTRFGVLYKKIKKHTLTCGYRSENLRSEWLIDVRIFEPPPYHHWPGPPPPLPPTLSECLQGRTIAAVWNPYGKACHTYEWKID